MISKNNKTLVYLFSVLISLNIFAWCVVWDLSRQKYLEVVFFDVGQGDSAFIQTPQSNQIIIDGGPGSSVLGKIEKRMPFWDRTIDMIILSHPDSDHLTGLIDVLKRYKVENVLWTGALKDSAEVAEWQRLIKEEGSNVVIAKAGQKITSKGLVLDVLYPFEDISGQIPKDTNQSSIVLRLSYGEKSFLFTGDIYDDQETALLGKGISVYSDVLKVAHHGSKTSSSDNFIAAVSPEAAVISLGKDNTYGHPHQQVLDILNKYGIKVLRTDINGDVEIVSDGNDLKLTADKNI